MSVYRFGKPEGDGAAFSLTPPANIFTAETIAARRATIIYVATGGEEGNSAPARTRLSRDTVVGTGTRTVLTPATPEQTENPKESFIVTSYGTTQPTTAPEPLLVKSWNHAGGGFEHFFAKGISIVAAISATLRQIVGSGAMSAEIHIEE